LQFLLTTPEKVQYVLRMLPASSSKHSNSNKWLLVQFYTFFKY